MSARSKTLAGAQWLLSRAAGRPVRIVVTRPPGRRCAVIAGNYREFTDWCREQGISPRDPGVLYATPESLRGHNDVEVRRTGSWAERDDLADIEDVLRLVNRR